MTTEEFVPVPTRAELAQRCVDSMSAVIPDIAPNESAVAWYWADFYALDAIERATQFNESARQNFLLTATGEGLRRKIREYGLDIDENTFRQQTDAYWRARAFSQIVSQTVGTEAYFQRVVRASNPVIADLSNVLDLDNNLDTVYVADENGSPLDAANLDIALTWLNANERLAMWDWRVLPAVVVNYLLEITGTYAHGSNDPTEAVRENADRTLAELRKLNTTISVARLDDGIAVKDEVTNMRTVRLQYRVGTQIGPRIVYSTPLPILRRVDTVFHLSISEISLVEEA